MSRLQAFLEARARQRRGRLRVCAICGGPVVGDGIGGPGAPVLDSVECLAEWESRDAW